MKKIFLSTALLNVLQGSVFANNPSTILRYAGVNEYNLGNPITVLEQKTFMVIIGAFVLLGLIWVGITASVFVRKMLSKPTSRGNAFGLLLFVAGISLFISSCSIANSAKTSKLDTGKKSENQTCLLTNHNKNGGNHPFSNRTSPGNYFDWNDAYTCKYCGQRVFTNR